MINMRILAVIFIIFLCTGISSAANFSTNEIEWDSAAYVTLYRGESLMNGEYTVKAVEFSSPVPGIKNMQGNIVPDAVVVPLVYLEIYKNGVFVEETVMGMASDPHISPDYEYRITVTEFPKRNSREWVYEYYKPWAKVAIQTRAYPELQLDITTNKTLYTTQYDRIIYAKVKIINKGGAFAQDVDVNFSIGELELNTGDIRELHHSYLRINRNSLESFMVTLLVPDLTDERSYVLSAEARGYDIKDKEYTASGSSSFTVTPQPDYFHIGKSARDRIYLGENDIVKIVVANGGIYDIHDITVEDTMNNNFELGENSSLQWNIPLLKPGEEWQTSYTMIPLKTNLDGFDLPEATAKFTVNNKLQKAYSEKTNVIVNGPIITLEKTTDMDVAYLNEDVTITVRINNIGDIPTKIKVEDSLPEGVSLVSGKTSLDTTFLELNTPQEFSYVIRRNTEGEVRLSPAVAIFTDIISRGTFLSELSSGSPTITFIDTSKEKPSSSEVSPSNEGTNKTRPVSQNKNNTESPSIQPTPMTPGFSSIYSIIMFIIITFLRQKRI